MPKDCYVNYLKALRLTCKRRWITCNGVTAQNNLSIIWAKHLNIKMWEWKKVPLIKWVMKV
jgi:hypothetical protein